MTIKSPTFLIVGSAKCGTTAMASILSSHPDCCMSNPKEVSFFQDTVDFEINPNFAKGWDWYKKAFSHYAGEAVVGEATPSYSDRTRSPNTAKRIFEFNPEMKIIYMVRDPLERQVSGWKMQHALGVAGINLECREHRWALDGFERWLIRQEEVGQWDECRYQYQIDPYLNFFGQDQVLVLFLEDWKKDQQQGIDNCCKFLGLESDVLPSPDKNQWNRAQDRRVEVGALKAIRGNQLFKSVVRLFPETLRTSARNKLAFKKALEPELGTMPPVASEFIEYVQDDCLAFLENQGKHQSYWSCFKK